MKKIKCKNYGLLTNTEVECDGRILVTNGLSIQQLVSLWRWYYNIPFWEEINLILDKQIYPLHKHCKLATSPSTFELFAEQKVLITMGE